MASLIISEVNSMLKELHLENSHRFKEIQAQLVELNLKMDDLEKKFQSKTLHDEKRYGHIQYKLFERKPN